MREFWEALDRAEPGAVFWAAVVWTASMLFVWTLCRAAAMGRRRVPRKVS